MMITITREMKLEALERLPEHIIFDFVKCSNCGFIGLVETQSDDCPNCNIYGCFQWADDDIQEYSLDGIRFETSETIIYKFDSLPDEGKEKALENLYDINISVEWWDYIYEDAKNVGIKITDFNLDRGSYCKGHTVENVEVVCNLIIKNHGRQCETYKTAESYFETRRQIYGKYPLTYTDDYCGADDYDEYGRIYELRQLSEDTTGAILEDYRVILQKGYGYLTSEKAIIETIKANDCEFTADGSLY